MKYTYCRNTGLSELTILDVLRSSVIVTSIAILDVSNLRIAEIQFHLHTENVMYTRRTAQLLSSAVWFSQTHLILLFGSLATDTDIMKLICRTAIPSHTTQNTKHRKLPRCSVQNARPKTQSPVGRFLHVGVPCGSTVS